MSRRVQLVLLCEDAQHEAFVRRFLQRRGWRARAIRVVTPAEDGRGAAEQFVRTRFPQELEAIRRGHVNRRLIVIIDGDSDGLDQRMRQLDEACRSVGIAPRRSEDHAAVIVPTWNIETWLAYLDGVDVDETRKDYPRLARQRDCQRHVDQLDSMCRSHALRQPAPPSLVAACSEFKARMESVSQSS